MSILYHVLNTVTFGRWMELHLTALRMGGGEPRSLKPNRGCRVSADSLEPNVMGHARWVRRRVHPIVGAPVSFFWLFQSGSESLSESVSFLLWP